MPVMAEKTTFDVSKLPLVHEQDALVVFTARSPSRIIAEGGSQAWVVNPAHAKMARWLVCTQNRHNPDHEFSDATEPHASAFLIGKISNVRKSTEEGAESRWIVEIGAFALVSIPDVWKQWRNPVRYTSLSDLGINPETLLFEPMPTAANPTKSHTATGVRVHPGMTIGEAKNALATTFGVSPDAIEITIRG
jgi:hypothetical protein